MLQRVSQRIWHLSKYQESKYVSSGMMPQLRNVFNKVYIYIYISDAATIHQQSINVINYSKPKIAALSENAPSLATISGHSKHALECISSSANFAYSNLPSNEQMSSVAKTVIENVKNTEGMQNTVKGVLDHVPNSVAIGAAGAIAGGIVVPLAVAAPPLLLGFWPGGILAGTPAAAWMASFGGAVPAGSLLAAMQSLGALGLTAPIIPIAAAIGSAGGAISGAVFGYKTEPNNTN
ncbi:hypothetical protein F4703DRAFT_1874453 [Phycomyces blakesleeanus]